MEPYIVSTETTTYVYESADMRVLREWHPRTESEPISPAVAAWKTVEATGTWTTSPNGTSVWSRK